MTILIIICLLTALINFIGISSLSARIVSTSTKKVASSTSIFNLVSLVSSFSNTIQAPLLAKTIESDINLGNPVNDNFFRIILFAATVGSILGALAIPTIHRFMKRGVESLYLNQSIFKLIIKAVSFKTLYLLKESFKIPSRKNFVNLMNFKEIPIGLVLMNIIVYGFMTVSVLSCLYAGYLNPSLRVTALSMSGLSNAVATLGMLLFIEPYNATLTDKVIDGSKSNAYFRRYLAIILGARILGTVLSQLLIMPLAYLIIKISEWLYF